MHAVKCFSVNNRLPYGFDHLGLASFGVRPVARVGQVFQDSVNPAAGKKLNWLAPARDRYFAGQSDVSHRFEVIGRDPPGLSDSSPKSKQPGHYNFDLRRKNRYGKHRHEYDCLSKLI